MELGPMEVGVLALSHYDTNGHWDGKAREAALALVGKGLLEQDPTSERVFRRTPEGAAELYRMLGAYLAHEVPPAFRKNVDKGL